MLDPDYLQGSYIYELTSDSCFGTASLRFRPFLLLQQLIQGAQEAPVFAAVEETELGANDHLRHTQGHVNTTSTSSINSIASSPSLTFSTNSTIHNGVDA